jgi:cell division protein ZapA
VTTKKTVIRVTIGSEEYTLKSDRPTEYTQAVAAHVDRTLKEVRSGGPIVETHKAAILAALAITDELFQTRAQQGDMTHRLRALTNDLARLLPPAKRRSRAGEPFGTTSEDA